jgi:predicted NBD/HSP70 family sugar kinase
VLDGALRVRPARLPEAHTARAAARIREDVRAGAKTAISALVGGDPARISARVWIEAVRAGDAYAEGLRVEYLDRLAQAIAILVIGLDTDCIALGTIVSQNTDLFLEPLRERVAARGWPRLRDTRIVAGALGERLPAYAGLVTALLEPPGVSGGSEK